MKIVTEDQRLRLAKPGKGLRADHENSRQAAIELFCEACIGGMATACPTHSCPLWPFRFGADDRQRDPAAVPTRGEYEAAIAKRMEGRENVGAGLAAWVEQKRFEAEEDAALLVV